jgi:hypothetical protein
VQAHNISFFHGTLGRDGTKVGAGDKQFFAQDGVSRGAFATASFAQEKQAKSIA